MALEELWKLFPIFLVPYDVRWNEYYAEIEDSIKSLLSDCPVYRISHIGSTAIRGIWAKNIVDVMVGKQYEHNRDAYTDAKTDFISKWTAEARKEYGNRY